MSQLKSAKQLGKGFHFELAHNTIKSGSRCGKEWPNISRMQNWKEVNAGAPLFTLVIFMKVDNISSHC